MLHNEYVLLLMFAYFHLSDIHALYLCWDPFADGQPVEWIMWPKAIQFSLKIAQYSAWDAGTWKLCLAILIKWGYNCKVWSVWRCSYPQHPNPLCSLPGLLKQVETYACGGSYLISGGFIFHQHSHEQSSHEARRLQIQWIHGFIHEKTQKVVAQFRL